MIKQIGFRMSIPMDFLYYYPDMIDVIVEDMNRRFFGNYRFKVSKNYVFDTIVIEGTSEIYDATNIMIT